MAPLRDARFEFLALVQFLLKVIIIKGTELCDKAHDLILSPVDNVFDERVVHVHDLTGIARLVEC